MTMNSTWGYFAQDQNWKSAEALMRNLIDITSKGGNYLLNVGPTAEGVIPAPSVERLKAVGNWLETNAFAIHGTSASPFRKAPAWGRCTSRALPDGNTRLYLHVFSWPSNGELVISGLTNELLKAELLAKPGAALTLVSAPGKIAIGVPEQVLDPAARVVALDVKGSAKAK